MTYQKVRKYCKEHNLSISAFEKKCEIGNGTIERWNKEGSKPSIGTLEKMAKATGISATEWLT